MTDHSFDAPSQWVIRFAPLIRPGGPVLELACGRGRHARFLAARGHLVEAVDRDEAALATLAGVPGVSPSTADLEGGPWPCPGRRFAAVVVTNYLHRPLFPSIVEALEDRGVLIYETFMRGHEQYGKPTNPHFLLEPGELLAAFGGLTVIAFEQGEVAAPRPAMVQRLCAVRHPEAILLPEAWTSIGRRRPTPH
jgi:SAM-dependent methyltransferase